MINLNHIITNLVSLLVFFIFLFAFTKILGPIPFDITQVTTSKSDAFSVTGEGKVEVRPDFVTVRLGVTSEGPTSKLAKDQMDANINKVVAAVKSIGISEEDIKTEAYNVYEDPSRYNSVLGEGKISYRGSTQITVKVKTVEIANEIVDVGAANGANQIGGVDFEVKDKSQSLNKARELAVSDAKKKAEDAARIAGFKLGKVINYSESEGGDYPIPMMRQAEDLRAPVAPTQFQPGTNEIVVTVSLSYEIK